MYDKPKLLNAYITEFNILTVTKNDKKYYSSTVSSSCGTVVPIIIGRYVTTVIKIH